MANEWYYFEGEKRIGPLSSQQLKSLASNGTLKPADLVWKEGFSTVVCAEKVKGLFEGRDAPETKESSDQPESAAYSIYWYYLSGNKQLGPVSIDAILDLIKSRQLQADDLVWNESLTDWLPASAATELSSTFSAISTSPSVTAVGGIFKGILEDAKANLKKGWDAPVEAQAPTKVEDETVPKPTEEPPRIPEGVQEEDIVFKCLAEYRGGHPNQTEACRGFLYLTRVGLFLIADQPQCDISIESKQILDISSPIPGSHSSEMIAKAEQSQALSGMGRQLSSFAGALVGGVGGAAIRAIGTSASGAASTKSILGPPPKNRLVAVLSQGGAKHKVIFDVMATDKQQMEELASSFWRKTASVRSTFSSSGAVANKKNSAVQNISADNKTEHTILKNGVVLAPISSDKLREMLEKGDIETHDLVRVEAWIPISAINLLGSSKRNEIGNSSVSLGDQSHNQPKSADVVVSAAKGNQKSSSTRAIAAGVGGLVAGATITAALTPGTANASQESIPNQGDGFQGIVLDTNQDGKADTVGLDLNHDGKIDAVAVDVDGDGEIDAVGVDTDHDGTLDAYGVDSNDDGEIDTYGFDTDGDGEVDVVDHDYEVDAEIDDFGSDDLDF